MNEDFLQQIRDLASRGTGMVTAPLNALSSLGESAYGGIQRLLRPSAQTGWERLQDFLAAPPATTGQDIQLPRDTPASLRALQRK